MAAPLDGGGAAAHRQAAGDHAVHGVAAATAAADDLDARVAWAAAGGGMGGGVRGGLCGPQRLQPVPAAAPGTHRPAGRSHHSRWAPRWLRSQAERRLPAGAAPGARCGPPGGSPRPAARCRGPGRRAGPPRGVWERWPQSWLRLKGRPLAALLASLAARAGCRGWLTIGRLGGGALHGPMGATPTRPAHGAALSHLHTDPAHLAVILHP